MTQKEKEAGCIITGVALGTLSGLYILFNNINETMQALNNGEDSTALVVFILAVGISGFTLLGCMVLATMLTLLVLRLTELASYVKFWRNNK